MRRPPGEEERWYDMAAYYDARAAKKLVESFSLVGSDAIFVGGAGVLTCPKGRVLTEVVSVCLWADG